MLSIIILLIGTVSLMMSIVSGEALEHWVEWISPEVFATFKRHEEYAEMARNFVFVALLLHGVSYTLKFYTKKTFILLQSIQILVALCVGALVALTGSEGGKLTHEYRVGAVHCQEMAHPLSSLSESLMPMEEANVRWENKSKSDSSMHTNRQVFESICKKSLTGSGSTLSK